MSNPYHIPVMLSECIDGLAIDPAGTYVDVTFGAGGHSQAIVDQLTTGTLYAFDQDLDAGHNLLDDDRVNFIQGNFRYLRKLLRLEGVHQIDGLLADLGVSSHQLDVPERGFSFRFDAPLDMRMSERSPTTARTVIETYDADSLQRILGRYGEVRNAKTLAQAIVRQRQQQPIATTSDLNDVLQGCIVGQRNRYFAQVYQALRIEVNEELVALEEMLLDVTTLLKPKGRLVVMSYHSLEDRLVKYVMKTGSIDGQVEQDEYGKITRPYKLLTRKPIMASDQEIERNPRSRSAKLRIAEKK